MRESLTTRVAWLALAAALLAVFALTGAWTVRMAIADHHFRRETLTGTQAALRLEPDSAEYYDRLAALIQDTNPAASTAALERAVALNPWDSQALVELGLRAEASGDLVAAERDLLRAASVDKLYLPKWSLANYYFRRGATDKFWLWARAATQMAYDNLTPLFTLCWKVTEDGALIERKLDLHKAGLQANYLAYLTSQNRFQPIPRAAAQLLAWNREADTPVLLAACDRLIADDHAEEAMGIWNKLSELRRIPYPTLAPRAGRSLTDGDFTMEPTSQGFDWRLPDVGGVTTLLDERPACLRVSFSGRQPENCDVLSQIVPIMAGAGYELRFLYRTTGIEPETGLRWRLMDLYGSKILAQGENLASESERDSKFTFKGPSCSGLARLTLSYQRALGTTRIEGSLLVRKLRLTETGTGPQAACNAE